MSAPTWTSFDRHARYSAIADVVRSFWPQPDVVADVGDGAGWMRLFAPEVRSFAVDLVPDELGVVGAARVRGDGTRLPLADGAVDVVVSSDSLEHVPPALRPAFLRELKRVARRGVVLAAPFDTPGVAGAEDLVRRWVVLSSGQDQPQLAEHAEHGLPDVAGTAEVLAEGGWVVRTAGNGSLLDWLGIMLVRLGMEARDELRPLSEGLDVAYNALLPGRRSAGPFYRHVVVATAEPMALPPAPAPEMDDAAVSALVAQLGHLTSQLQLSMLSGSVAGVPGAVGEVLEARFSALQASIDELRTVVDDVHAMVKLALTRFDEIPASVERATVFGMAKRARRRAMGHEEPAPEG